MISHIDGMEAEAADVTKETSVVDGLSMPSMATSIGSGGDVEET